jgi:sigma-B regulation protein RsbU (phosphoserine phosphatase)
LERRRPPGFLRHAIESLDDGLVVVDVDGRCRLANAAARRLLAVAPSAAVDWPLEIGGVLGDGVTPCAPEEGPVPRTLRGETVLDLELRLPAGSSRDGVWLSVNGAPIRGARGVIEGAVIVLRDVSNARRRIDQVILLSNVVEGTADAVIVTDRSGRIEYVNPGFEATTGYSRAEVLGHTPAILKSGAHGREFYAGLWRTLADGKVFRGTFTNRKKGGELFFTEQTITPIRREGGRVTHMVSVGKDVTQARRAAERESALLLARSVQQRLFPPSQPVVPGFDVFGATFLADVTGGDYYDFISLAGERLGIVVADVSGHGFDSALLMAETRAVLRATAQTTSDLGEILAVVNRVLHADTEAHRFATVLFVSLHVPSGSLTYCSAGHPSGHLLDERGSVKGRLEATGLPLGMFPASTYATRSLQLTTGDTLLLLTDGVTDCGTPEGDLFGVERALAAVRACLGAPASDIVEGLYRAVRTFETGGQQRDDVTTVVVRCLAAGGRRGSHPLEPRAAAAGISSQAST